MRYILPIWLTKIEGLLCRPFHMLLGSAGIDGTSLEGNLATGISIFNEHLLSKGNR